VRSSGLALVAIWTAVAHAAPVTLKLATVAPDGTEYAREFRAFARNVETETGGAVTIRWYFGGIAGDELQVADRIGREQLDGVASGGMLCANLSPTMRAMRVALVQNGDEARFMLGHLRERITAELAAAGMESLGTPVLGSEYAFLDRSVKTMAELRQLRLWRWDLDDAATTGARLMGLNIVPLPIDGLKEALEAHQVDGFIAVPSASLAFQWSIRAHVLLRMPLGFLAGCLLVAQRTWHRLRPSERTAISGAAAIAMKRMDDMMQRQDAMLLGGLFQRQGMQLEQPSPALRSQFYEALRAARERLPDGLVPREVLERVQLLLSDFRAEHNRD
jgi:TRAP-type C4-dicarboxylate transport system substrate-binding protein